MSCLHSVHIWGLLPQMEALVGLRSLAQVHGQAVISELQRLDLLLILLQC